MRLCLALLAAVASLSCGTSTSPPDGGAGGTLYSIGGLIQTAGANGLVLATPGEPNLTILAPYEPPFAFATSVPSGTAYDVTVFAQPTRSDCGGGFCNCVITDGGIGTVGNADVTSVLVRCAIALP
jgi:hypothetical protein